MRLPVGGSCSHARVGGCWLCHGGLTSLMKRHQSCLTKHRRRVQKTICSTWFLSCNWPLYRYSRSPGHVVSNVTWAVPATELRTGTRGFIVSVKSTRIAQQLRAGRRANSVQCYCLEVSGLPRLIGRHDALATTLELLSLIIIVGDVVAVILRSYGR